MHDCPECGQGCCCHGDLDDCLMDTEDTYLECVHLCEPIGEDENYDLQPEYDDLTDEGGAG